MHAPPPVVVSEPVSAEPETTEAAPDPLRAVLPDSLETALSRTPPLTGDPAIQEQLVRSARSLLDRRNIVVAGERVRHDCIGMVAAAYTMSGMDITHSISDLFEQAVAAGIAHNDKRPRPGDIVFFDDSYDKNRNGVRDDPFTHVTIVERVDAEGTITMIHLGGKGKPVARRMMNLYHPDDKRDAAGNTINSTLRSVNGRDGGPELTSQLFRGFGSIWRLADESGDSSGK
jgi:hypothetical protein